VSEQLRRIGTALIAAPVVIALAYAGGWPFAVLIAGIGAVAQSELYDMARTAGEHPAQLPGLVLGALLVGAALAPGLGAAALAWGVGFLVASPFLLPQAQFLSSLCITLAGAVYPAGLLGTLVAIREGPGPEAGLTGFWLTLMTLFLVWATDIFAYYTGRSLGRTPLAPDISPNKTWEGSLGGAAAAVVVALGFKGTVLPALSSLDVAALLLGGGILSQTGDLAESQLKRSTGTKDASSILPGHGGLFDRFDAMVVAAPLIYLYLRFGTNFFA
jgi:phosphatidate cytidylyltransferase